MRESRLLRFMAICFLIAPFGNLLISLIYSGVPDWWEPLNFIALVKQIRWMDWLWLSLVFVSGLLLLMRHKTAWLVAVLTLFLVIALDVSSLLDSPYQSVLTSTEEIQILFSNFLSFCVLIILFYARYPYLDRRQGWLKPTAHRYDLQTPVRIHADKIFDAVTESVSSTGCRVHLDFSWGRADRLRFLEIDFLEVPEVRIRALVVGAEGSELRLKFRSFTKGNRSQFKAWLDRRIKTRL